MWNYVEFNSVSLWNSSSHSGIKIVLWNYMELCGINLFLSFFGPFFLLQQPVIALLQSLLNALWPHPRHSYPGGLQNFPGKSKVFLQNKQFFVLCEVLVRNNKNQQFLSLMKDQRIRMMQKYLSKC